ncbi:MAG TPA: acetyl-CoA carboxylase carboxyltransferase subunit alpha [Phycisphaerae bacterium]|nr:acetyl-CoA carboxylase carboxyltransferase subunit alpha [Phycisphaerae bacterium]
MAKEPAAQTQKSPSAVMPLEFEKPILSLERQINDLVALQETKGADYAAEINSLRQNLTALLRKTYQNLSAWETVQVARHPARPQTRDYIEMIVKDFDELHGDRTFGDDKTIVTGMGRIGGHKVMVIGHQKGRTTDERIACNFGCAHPEGYRKALAKMEFAEKFGLPIVTFIDTPGAYPGIGSEERGVAEAIAINLREMARLKTPIVCIVIGEGGSGGALGIGVGDRLAMMQYAWYSVISPEGCSGILWKDGKNAPEAAEALKLTSKHLKELGIIDEIIEEPLGAAHRNPRAAADTLERYIDKTLRELKRLPVEKLTDNRYDRIRKLGTDAVTV